MQIRSSLMRSHRAWLFGAVVILAGCDFEVEVSGSGRVVSDPAGIDCRAESGSCIVEDYEKLGDGNDKVVTRLTAIADEGAVLSHWEGDCAKTKHNNCYVPMSGDLFVKAVFKPMHYANDPVPQTPVRFVALGDTGEGNLAQYLVADAIWDVCEAKGGCDFAIGLGDNIYDENPLHTSDTAFDQKFELPYQKLEFPFYMSLGNHDNDLIIDGTGGSNIAGDVQVEYTYRENKLSDKWQLPDRYYHFGAPLGSTAGERVIDFFVLDSNPLNSAPDINPEYEINAYKAAQGAWLDGALAVSSAPWKMAYTHHPYVSNGSHGNAGRYDRLLPLEPVSARISGEIYRQWFEQHVCGKIDLFIAGHDHDLQMLKSVPECGKTFFIISGAGAKSRSIDDAMRNVSYWQEGDTTGFFLLETKGNTLFVTAYTVDGDTGDYRVAYENVMQRRVD
ncbi:hypothetical protein OLMES_1259 [Oleiphilus messinensis]|uniref:Calcineurin-like phosphoesterase domain-containing protein n=1 Tax=Oleiphilus messinensis TaxID=141451 RepID=A0A1Y0I4K5_9GAMM|nr:metallophosphoesterase [Oleiphilus messinensis]ARU55341.1 hypothetical protein OLMES_1259 [Oleiphilus messinensis]